MNTPSDLRRPESYSAVPPDFDGPVLIELAHEEQRGRGRFYRPEAQGYTDDPLRAGVWPGSAGIGRAHGLKGRYAVSAELVLADERARLEAFAARIEAAKNGSHDRSPHARHEEVMTLADEVTSGK